MECIEARALKSSFLPEITMISTQQVCFDAFASVTCGDDFSVDDLLDLNDKYFEECSQQESEEDESTDSFSLNHDAFCNKDDSFGPLPDGELALPVDDVENLEWLSQIVYDSVTEISLLCPVGIFQGKTASFLNNMREPGGRPPVQRIMEPRFPLPSSKKPRAKRSRPTGRVVWTLGSPSLLLTPESSSTTSYGSSTVSPVSVFGDPVEDFEFFSKPPAKKQKKRPAGDGGSGFGGSQTLRRCSHCQVQKTPQWRTGPLGPKTLCNACGVRYKTGRLFPEYRPACSPTFSREIHSNSHRKVLEMRRMKEVSLPVETGVTPSHPSF